MIQEENKIHLLWTCLASMALEHCLPKVGTCCSRDYHPSSGCAWLKSLTLLPESCPYPQETCKSKDCVSNPTGDGIVSCIPFASKAKPCCRVFWWLLETVRLVLGSYSSFYPQRAPFASVQGTCLKAPPFSLVLHASVCEMGREALLLSKAL